MTAPKVRADYETLASIAQSFLREADGTQKVLGNLRQCLDALKGGDWVGRGATAFYREMDHDVLPTVKRLEGALRQAGRLTRQISQLMKQAEDDAAALFRYLGWGGALDGAGAASTINALYQPGGLFGGATIVPAYAVSGPWGVGSPVHEVLTLAAIRKALEAVPPGQRGDLLRGVALDKLPSLDSGTAHDLNTKKIDPSAQQFIRGAVWPDDPKGYLFDDPKSTENYSSGAKWYEEFDKDERNDPAALIARSHYGDLQYFHGMAPVDNQDPQMTKDNMLNWSRFLTDVSTGRIDPDTRVADVPLTKELFPAHGGNTLKELFAYEGATDLEARQRAAGALNHMIQDSYAAGHVDRNPLTGAITQFHSYGSQDSHLHGQQDEWGEGRTLADRFQGTHGAQSAYDESARVLVMLDKGVPTDTVVRYLDQRVFQLDPAVQPSGPGDQFRPRKPATQRT
jgi:WXG100 family type VII secretion target